MINKDSIVTAYDEHLTLVEWLQKVKNALNNAVLTNLGIAKLSDQGNVATYQVTATFADNTSIASDSFTLPSTDIVTAFNNLATLVKGFDSRIATNKNNVNSILDIIDIAGEKINADALKNSINGDDNVIVKIDNVKDDDDEDDEKLGIHLSPDLTVNTITADTIKIDSYLKPVGIEPSEGDINPSIKDPFKDYLTIDYFHWRVSNGKLNIVLYYHLNGSPNTGNKIVEAFYQTVKFPSVLLEKLYGITHNNATFLENKISNPVILNNIVSTTTAEYIIMKHQTDLGFILRFKTSENAAITYDRIETNFIL